jgi:hypothetical protein
MMFKKKSIAIFFRGGVGGFYPREFQLVFIVGKAPEDEVLVV